MPSYNYERFKLYRDIKKVYILEYLLEHPCIDCGENDLRVLEFDHQDPSTKVGNVSWLSQRGNNSLMVVKAEIEKCLVRCSNCHQKKTTGDPDWFLDFNSFKESVLERQLEKAHKAEMRKVKCGKRRSYQNGCRCVLCKQAQSAYQKKWLEKKQLKYAELAQR